MEKLTSNSPQTPSVTNPLAPTDPITAKASISTGRYKTAASLEAHVVGQPLTPPFEHQLTRQLLVDIKRVKDRAHTSPLQAAKIPQLRTATHEC